MSLRSSWGHTLYGVPLLMIRDGKPTCGEMNALRKGARQPQGSHGEAPGSGGRPREREKRAPDRSCGLRGKEAGEQAEGCE